MENATKAMLMAAGVLIGVMILSLGAALYSELQSYVESSQETMRFTEIKAFNNQFTVYLDRELTIQDVVTAANIAHENNIEYNIIDDVDINAARGEETSAYVAVFLDNGAGYEAIEADIQDILTQLLAYNIDSKYRCTALLISEVTGRVYEIYFEKDS